MSDTSNEEEFYDAFESEEALRKNSLIINKRLIQNEKEQQQQQQQNHQQQNQKHYLSEIQLAVTNDLSNNAFLKHDRRPVLMKIESKPLFPIDSSILPGIILGDNRITEPHKNLNHLETEKAIKSVQLIKKNSNSSIDSNFSFNSEPPNISRSYSQTNSPDQKSIIRNHLLLKKASDSIDESSITSRDNYLDDSSAKSNIKSSNYEYFEPRLKDLHSPAIKTSSQPKSSNSCSEDEESKRQRSDSKGNISNIKMTPSENMSHKVREAVLDNNKFTKETLRTHDKLKSDFDNLILLQEIPSSKIKTDNEPDKKSNSSEAIWVAKFSPDEKHLAMGGVDGILRVFKVKVYDEQNDSNDTDLINPHYKSFIRHTFDIINIAWHTNSINMLTGSIDNKAILWNVFNENQIRVFDHSDIVSSVAFHPLVDDFFASGSFDKMIRIWDISDNKVVDWIQTTDLITAMAFSPDNQHVIVGLFKGNCKIYRIDQGKLKFVREISCKNKYSFGKLNKTGKKVTSIIFTDDLEFLVTTNDSRMRLFDFNNFSTIMKYKGHANKNLLSSASYNYEKQKILIGSEDGKVYIFNREPDYGPQVNPMYTLRTKNRNTSYEYFIPFSKLITPCAIWVPFNLAKRYRESIIKKINQIYIDCIMITISFESDIKIFGNVIELNT